jgi:hypothetical protein
MRYGQTCLGDLIRIKHGFAFKSQFFRDSGKYVVLTPGHFFEAGGFRDRPEKDRFYEGEFPDEFILPDHALIIAMTEQGSGLLGSSALVPEADRYLHNQRIGLVTIRNPADLDKEFLYRLFNTRSVRAQIESSASGTKVRHTAPDRVYRLSVSIPPLDSQEKIGAVLRSYDNLIEINQRRIRLLEEAARLLYQEWFVRFRFPGHEHVQTVNSVPKEPAQRHRVANVALNLCSQKSSAFSSARWAAAFRSSRKFIFTLQPEVGNTKLHVLLDLAFRAFRLVTNFAGIGISRSLYAFGVHPQSDLWLTRTVQALKLMSDQ